MLRATASGLSHASLTGSSAPGSTSAATAPEVTSANGERAESTAPPVALTAAGAPLDADGGKGDHANGEADNNIGATQAAPPAAAPAPARRGRTHPLREVAQNLLDVWDAMPVGDQDLVGAMHSPIVALRAATGACQAIATAASGVVPKRDTKQVQVLAMLRRSEGASGPAIAEATGWAPHTVRGFLAGLAKKGIQAEVLERVRQVGPNKQGAKGSYTVYRVAGMYPP